MDCLCPRGVGKAGEGSVVQLLLGVSSSVEEIAYDVHESGIEL